MTKPYARPLNAGLPSEPHAAGRRIARLLAALDYEVNGYIVEGQILDDIRALKLKILDNLEKEGWRCKVTESARWSILPPKER